MAREFDPSTQLIDGEIVMSVGGGKKHGRFWIGDRTIDTTNTPTLLQIQARSTSLSPAIRPRPNTTEIQMAALKHISVYPSFLDFYICLFCVLTVQSNIVGPDVSRLSSTAPSTTGGGGGDVTGQAGEDAERVSADMGGRMPETGSALKYMHTLGSAMGLSPPPFTLTPLPLRAATPTPVSDLTTF